MSNKRGEPAGIDPRSLLIGPGSQARKYASEELIAAAGAVSRRPPARRASWLGGLPWRQLAWSALAGALAAALVVLALVWSGWTIW
jgi:hypothetical protein